MQLKNKVSYHKTRQPEDDVYWCCRTDNSHNGDVFILENSKTPAEVV